MEAYHDWMSVNLIAKEQKQQVCATKQPAHPIQCRLDLLQAMAVTAASPCWPDTVCIRDDCQSTSEQQGTCNGSPLTECAE
jgi:hypothetical protein